MKQRYFFHKTLPYSSKLNKETKASGDAETLGDAMADANSKLQPGEKLLRFSHKRRS